MEFPEDLRYTKEHEWARIDQKKNIAVIGITDYAQDKLGDVVYVELPEEGEDVQQDESFGTVESVKAVSDLYAPISGKVLEANDALLDSPEAVNEDAYGEAWLIKVEYSNKKDLDKLLSVEEYKQFLAAEEEGA